MIRRLLIEERGYSLVEVMASIIILAIAILPMAGMFDMGLRTATTGSNYDKARTLANLKLEEAKSLPFDTVRGQFPGERRPSTTARATINPPGCRRRVPRASTSRTSTTWSRSSTWRSRPRTRLTLLTLTELDTEMLRKPI